MQTPPREGIGLVPSIGNFPKFDGHIVYAALFHRSILSKLGEFSEKAGAIRLKIALLPAFAFDPIKSKIPPIPIRNHRRLEIFA